jgi:hypothetical protein
VQQALDIKVEQSRLAGQERMIFSIPPEAGLVCPDLAFVLMILAHLHYYFSRCSRISFVDFSGWTLILKLQPG